MLYRKKRMMRVKIMNTFLPDYTIENKAIYDSSKTLIWGGIREADKKPIVVKLLKEEYPSPSEIERHNCITYLLGILKVDLCSYAGRPQWSHFLLIVTAISAIKAGKAWM